MSYPSVSQILEKKGLSLDSLTEEQAEKVLLEAFQEDLPIGFDFFVNNQKNGTFTIDDEKKLAQVKRLVGYTVPRRIMEQKTKKFFYLLYPKFVIVSKEKLNAEALFEKQKQLMQRSRKQTLREFYDSLKEMFPCGINFLHEMGHEACDNTPQQIVKPLSIETQEAKEVVPLAIFDVLRNAVEKFALHGNAQLGIYNCHSPAVTPTDTDVKKPLSAKEQVRQQSKEFISFHC
jgi:hypothetical protein